MTKRKTLPKSHPMPDKSGMAFYAMSGADAKIDANVLKLFEQIKGRKATDQEVAELMALSRGTEPDETG